MATYHRPSRMRDKNKTGITAKLSKMQVALIAIGIVAAVGVSITVAGFLTDWTFGLSVAPEPVTPPAPTGEYDLSVINAWDGEDLNDANVSYWDADSDGLPDDLLDFGAPDNVSMLNYDFEDDEIYWAKVELSGFQTKWAELNTVGTNVISLVELPTVNATGSILNSTGNTWYNNTSDEGTIRFTFDYTTQNGTGFEPYYDAAANETTWVILEFLFNGTPSESLVTVDGEIEDDKDVDTNTLVIPVDISFMCGESLTTNYLVFTIDVGIGAAYEISQIQMIYDGVVYGTIAVTAAP